MMPLYEFDEAIQRRLIGSHLQHHGRLIGRAEGAFGDVFTFERDAHPSHIVAKCPKIRRFGSTAKARGGLGKLIDELANTMRYYRHPGVHRMSGVELVHGWPFLISRFRTGTLADLIAEPPRWKLSEKLACILQVAHAINYCRRQGLVAHQDLKPSNILFDTVRDKYSIEGLYAGLEHETFVADFGVADAFRDFGKNTGSRPYMAPEQYTKDLIEDGSRMDVFGLAVIAFECLTDGLHPIGVRTSDVWPVPLPDKPSKWSHEDIWKSWARRAKKGLSDYLSNRGPTALQDLIATSLSAEAHQRPSMDQFECVLWNVLQTLTPHTAAGVRMQVDYLDGLAGKPESRWDYMERRLQELRELYARWERD